MVFKTMLLTRRLLIVLLNNYESLLLKVSKAIDANPLHTDEILEMESMSASVLSQHKNSFLSGAQKRRSYSYLITEIKTKIEEKKMIIIAFLGKKSSSIMPNCRPKRAISALKLDKRDAYTLFGIMCEKAVNAGWDLQTLPAWLKQDEKALTSKRTIN